MLDKNNIGLIGYSGHAYVVLEATQLSGYEILGYCEKQQTLNNPYDLEYLGFEGDDEFNWNLCNSFVLGIGENNLRSKVGELLRTKNKSMLNIIHPTAVLSPTLRIGHGNFIGAITIINALASIGNYCILNTGSIVEHECIIGDGAHVAPGVVLAGNVKVGENTFIGANSVVRQGVKIGDNVIIGAGSTVLKDIPNNETWFGNPAKLFEK